MVFRNIVNNIGLAKLKNIAVNVGFNGVKSLFNFLLLPVLTFYLSEGDMGVIALFMACIAYVRQLNSANIQTFLWKKYFDKTDYEGYKLVAFWLLLIICLFFFIVAFIFHDYLFEKFGWYYFTIPLWGLFEAFVIIKNAEYFAEDRVWPANLVTLTRVSAEFAFSLLIVVYLDNTFTGRVNGYLIGVGVVGIVSFIKFLPSKIKIPKKSFFKDTFKFIIPFFPSMIFSWVIQFSDRFLIERYVNLEQLGIYNVAYSIGIVVLTLDSAIAPVWTNIFYKKNNDGVDIKKILKIKVYYSGLILCATLFIWLMAKFVYQYFIDEKFGQGIEIVPFIAFAYLFNSIARTFMLIQWKQEKTFFISISSFIAMIINVGLNYYLLPKWGIIGAGFSVLVTYFVIMILNMIYSVKLLKEHKE